MTGENITAILVVLFGSTGFWAFITSMIQRPQIKEVLTEVSKVNAKVEELSSTIDRNNADNSRTRILRFDDELYEKRDHTAEYFMQILSEIDVYEDYCRQHPEYENNRAVEAIRHIREVYRYCRDNHKFL